MHYPFRLTRNCCLDGCSRKSQELKAFPHAAITFWWGALHRSVRFEGEVAMVSEEESDTYFSCRPTGSKVRQETEFTSPQVEALYARGHPQH